MTTQQLVDPSNIEPELLKLWEGLAKEKMRACLFNLIVFNKLSSRTDYIREIVRKVSEKYPCRVLFITEDPNANIDSIKTAISVVGDGNIACDYIDIGVSGKDIERVPFVILPHFITDLPIALLWTEDPSKSHPLFEPLSKLTHRIIFDSESADSLLAFSKKVLSLKGIKDTADLNWARTEGWRELIATLFRANEKLHKIKHVAIKYNSQGSQSFCHLKVQSLYLLSWLTTCLGWKFKGATKDLKFTFDERTAQITEEKWNNIAPGMILSVDIETDDGCSFHAARAENQQHHVTIKTSTPEKCEIPTQFVLGETSTGQSLITEIITKGTSAHYLKMLESIQELDKDELC